MGALSQVATRASRLAVDAKNLLASRSTQQRPHTHTLVLVQYGRSPERVYAWVHGFLCCRSTGCSSCPDRCPRLCRFYFSGAHHREDLVQLDIKTSEVRIRTCSMARQHTNGSFEAHNDEL